MTDRELLELAAKAAGLEIKPHGNARLFESLMFVVNGKNWNPLTDDGDALRLAVKLGIAIIQPSSTMGAAGFVKTDVFAGECCIGADPHAATRRAVVRAAAEIGRGL